MRLQLDILTTMTIDLSPTEVAIVNGAFEGDLEAYLRNTMFKKKGQNFNEQLVKVSIIEK